MKAKATGVVSLIVAVVAVINFVLAACGLPAIPVDESAITGVVAGLIGLAGVAGTMWTNFNGTTAAQVGQHITDGIKNGTIDLGEAQKLITDTAMQAKSICAPEITD